MDDKEKLAELEAAANDLLDNIALTGTYNRRGYVKALNRLAEAMDRHPAPDHPGE